MSTAIETPKAPANIREYIKSICEAEPTTALELAMAETDRQRAALQRVQEELRLKQEELRDKSEVTIDSNGRFVAKNLAGLEEIGRMYAASDLVPDHYKGKPANCAIAAQMAMRCKVDVFLFMQASYVVHGKCGIEGKLVIAMINSSGQINGRIRWKFEGEGKTRKCTAYVTDAFSGETLEQTVTWAMVEAEKWNKDTSSKWNTLPEMMFKYRSATFLARTSFPDVIMGMHTVDELEDIAATEVASRKPIRSLDDLTDALGGNKAEVTTQSKSVESQQRETTTEPPVAERPLGLEGVKEMMMAVTDDMTAIGSIAKGIREARELTPEEDNQLDEMAELHRERIRSARGTRSNKPRQQELGDAYEGE